MKCPICAQAELIRDTRDIPYTYKRESITIAKVTGEFCPACDEAIFDAKESRRISAQMQALNKQVNGKLVDAQFITHIRIKLNLDQREAGEIFGGGVNAFSRYETGKTKPPKALIKLLKILDRYPELLPEVRAS